MSTTIRKSLRRRGLHLGLLLLLLAGMLALTEFILWGWHYGRPTAFLQQIHESGTLRFHENVHAYRAYQSGLWPVPEDTFVDLAMPKPPATCRIFVFGGSAAMGYPPDAATGLARTLEVQLEAAYEGIRFEVHNLAFPGMNSHAVREAAEECAAYEPNFFVVLTGLEEVYGAYGFLTSGFLFEHPAWVPWRVWLKRRQLTQLVAHMRGANDALTATEPRAFELPAPEATEWVRMTQTFRDNLAAMAASARQAGAGVLLCTAPFEVAGAGEAAGYARVLTLTNETVREFAAKQEACTLVDLASEVDSPADFFDNLHPRMAATHRMAGTLVNIIGEAMGRDPAGGRRLSLEEARAALGLTPAVDQMHLITMRRAVTELGPMLGVDVTAVASRLDREIAALDQSAAPEMDAVLLLRQALETRPIDYYLNRQLAVALNTRGDAQGAREVLEALIHRYPDRAALHCDLASICLGEADHSQALEALRRGLAADRWNVEVYWLLGMTLLESRPDQASPSLVRGLALLPGGPEIPGSVDAYRERVEAALSEARNVKDPAE